MKLVEVIEGDCIGIEVFRFFWYIREIIEKSNIIWGCADGYYFVFEL